jgi:hypothetical protein
MKAQKEHMSDKEVKKLLSDLKKNHAKGEKLFKSRYNKKKYKKFKKVVKKKDYVEYRYALLPYYFTHNTSFYYNLDSGLAKLLYDLIFNYYLIASQVVDMSENNLGENIKYILTQLKKYPNMRDTIEFKDVNEYKKYYDKEYKKLRKAFKLLGKIFNSLWY